MERRFRVRLDELLDDAEVLPGLLRAACCRRLQDFLQPFVASAAHARTTDQRPALRPRAVVRLEKQGRGIDRLPARPRTAGFAEVHRSGGVGPPTAVDRVGPASRGGVGAKPTPCWSSTPRPFPRRGRNRSGSSGSGVAGSARSTTVRLASTWAYVSAVEHALVDCRLYLPKEWAGRKRRQKAGVPADVRFRTRQPNWPWRCWTKPRPWLPHAWVSGDDEMGRCAWFR